MALTHIQIQERAQRFNALRDFCRSAGQIRRITTALRLDPREDKDQQEAMRWMMTVLAEVEKTLGNEKMDLTICNFDSLVQAMIDAATIGIPIDGRKLAEIIPYAGRASYQINTAGYEYLISLHYDDADFKTGAVFDGDTFTIHSKDGFDTYEHTVADAFAYDTRHLRGVFVVFSYSKGGRQYQHIERLSTNEIGKIRNKAKQGFVWEGWFIERAKTAAIKRIAKRHAKTVAGLKEAVDYDNQRNFDLNAPALPAPSAGTIIDNLNAAIEKREAAPQIENKARTEAQEVLPMDAAQETQEAITPPQAEQQQARQPCQSCNGSGRIEWMDEDGAGGIAPCDACKGSGAA